MTDTTGIILHFNKKAEELTGYSLDDLAGQDFFYMLLPEHSRADAMESFIRNLTGGNALEAFSLPVRTKTGNRLPVSWSISLVRDDDGKVSGMLWLGFFADRTIRDAEVSYVSDPFYSYVGSMAHDLLNHSQVAMGYLELAMERAGDDEKLRCMLDRACRAVKRCGDIAGDVHKLSYGSGLNGHIRMTPPEDERRE